MENYLYLTELSRIGWFLEGLTREGKELPP